MKTIKETMHSVWATGTVAAAFLLHAAPAANAELVLLEQFDYPVEENVDGQDGGIGFDGPWNSSVSHGRIYAIGLIAFSGGDSTIVDENGGLTFGALPVAGGALSRFGSAGRAQANRRLSEDSMAALLGDGTTIWFSVLFAGSAGGFKHGTFVFGTDKLSRQGTPALGDGSNDRNPPYEPVDGDGFGFTLQSEPGGSGQGFGSINALAYDNFSDPIVFEGTFTPEEGDDPNHQEPTLVVGKITWNPVGTPDEFYLFTVTDLSAEPDEDDAIASITDLDFDQSAFDTVAMWDSNHSIFDEIRFGNSFGDVTGGGVAPSLPFVITDVAFMPAADGAGPTVTLTWTSEEGEVYKVDAARDPANWVIELDDAIDGDAGETTTRAFDLNGFGLGAEKLLFFRVEKR